MYKTFLQLNLEIKNNIFIPYFDMTLNDESVNKYKYV